MKKSIIIAAIAALALVSCRQPTKEEQQMKTIMQAVDKHINANFEYPKGYEVTDVKIDTVTTNHKCRKDAKEDGAIRRTPDVRHLAARCSIHQRKGYGAPQMRQRRKQVRMLRVCVHAERGCSGCRGFGQQDKVSVRA